MDVGKRARFIRLRGNFLFPFGQVSSILCFSNADFVIESIAENFEVKKAFFRHIGSVVFEDCIIATNTSGPPISAPGTSVYKPERFAGMHWINPPHVSSRKSPSRHRARRSNAPCPAGKF